LQKVFESLFSSLDTNLNPDDVLYSISSPLLHTLSSMNADSFKLKTTANVLTAHALSQLVHHMPARYKTIVHRLEMSLLGEQRQLHPEDRRLFCARFAAEAFPEVISEALYDQSIGLKAKYEQDLLAKAIDEAANFGPQRASMRMEGKRTAFNYSLISDDHHINNVLTLARFNTW